MVFAAVIGSNRAEKRAVAARNGCPNSLRAWSRRPRKTRSCEQSRRS